MGQGSVGSSPSSGTRIDFVRLLISMIHERSFNTSTTYPFACLIFLLCREDRVPISHSDTLRHPVGTVDIGLIDDSNVTVPRRGPRIEVPLLSKNFVETVDLTQGPDPTGSASALTTPAKSSHATRRPHSSSQSKPPSAALVLLVWVQKLVA